MATVFDSEHGTIKSVGGGEYHRRLVDMGLVGASFTVKARRRDVLLVDYGDFAAVTRRDVAQLLHAEVQK